MIPLMPGWADEPDSLAGTGLAEDVSSLASSLSDGDWAEAQLHGVGVGLGVAGAVIDPVGALASAAAGWAMDHIEPLRTWLDDLAGDPGAVMDDSGLLENAGRVIDAQSLEILATSTLHLMGMQGRATSACGEFARSASDDAAAVALLLKAGSSAIRLASGIVDGVRSLVRDAIAEVVGMATSSAATLMLSGGVVAPAVAARIAFRVESLSVKLAETLKSVARSFEALRVLLRQAESALDTLIHQSRGRRPLRIAIPDQLPITWTGEVVRRLESIRPHISALEVLPGAVATVVEGPGE